MVPTVNAKALSKQVVQCVSIRHVLRMILNGHKFYSAEAVFVFPKVASL